MQYRDEQIMLANKTEIDTKVSTKTKRLVFLAPDAT